MQLSFLLKNVIISEKEAQDLVDKQSILTLMEAKGRPFFTDSITADVMDEIKQPLAADEVSRKHVIDYKVGTTGNEKEQQANLIVVKMKQRFRRIAVLPSMQKMFG